MKPNSAVQDFDAFRANSYFTALDGLRGLSILLVLLHHMPPYEAWIPAVLHHNGRYGVSFFFIISGFLICSLLLREEEKTGRISLGRFYARRALRLLPLYYVVLALQVVMVFGLKQYTPENRVLFAEKLPSYLFYYSNWLESATQGPFFCAWSLAAEEQFYLAFGLLLVLCPRKWLVGLVATALGAKFLVFQFIGPVDAWSATARVLFSYQEAIFWGVLLAFALHQRAIYTAIARACRSPWLVGGCGAIIVGWLLTHPIQSANTWDAELLYLLMLAVTAGVVIRRTVPVLSSGLLAHIGRVSYGVYLLHMFIISAVKKLPHGTDPIVCFVISVPITIGVATLVYRYFELPIINYYKRRFAPRPAKADVVAAPGTVTA